MAGVFQQEPTEDLKIEALKLCQEFLGGSWKCITLEDFNFSTVSGGLSNSLYRCALPKTAVPKDTNVPSDVLLRIYGPVQEDPSIVVPEAATFMLLSERNLGPKLYGIFPKGRLEEFIPSRSLCSAEIRQHSTIVARELAKIHALSVPIRKEPDFWLYYVNKWVKEIEDVPKDKNSEFGDIGSTYRPEIAWLWGEIRKSKCSTVYCHNDLQGGNILLRADSEHLEKPQLLLIDFEFGAYNYSCFDIANQFCEWCFDYNTKEYPHFTYDFSKFPSKEEQVEYIRAYLDQLTLEGVQLSRTFEEETKIILEEVTLFCMAANLVWSLWSIKMILLSSMEFSHREHMKVRRKAYEMYKEAYMESSLFNGAIRENCAPN